MIVGFMMLKNIDSKDTIHKDYDDHSQAYFPHMDKENGQLLSLNIEAYKMSKDFILQMRPWFDDAEKDALANLMDNETFLTEFRHTKKI